MHIRLTQKAVTPAVVWYRASGDCPHGDEFLGKLGDRASATRLAQAGDHLDFVVTLQTADHETVGRVERQTERGTVAIRELRDPSCARVAEALALSLSLSLQPKDGQGASAAEPVAPTPGPGEEPAGTPTVAASARVVKASATTPTPLSVSRPTTTHDTAPVSRPHGHKHLEGGWMGAQIGALTGVAPRALARGAASVSFENIVPEVLNGASLRFSPVFAYGSSKTKVGAIEQWLLAARAEGCLLRLGTPAFGVSPCGGFEIGLTHAAASDFSDSGESNLWLAVGVGLRAALGIAPGTQLELQAEAQAPLFRNEIAAGSIQVYRQEIIGFQGGLGISTRLW